MCVYIWYTLPTQKQNVPRVTRNIIRFFTLGSIKICYAVQRILITIAPDIVLNANPFGKFLQENIPYPRRK